MVKKDYETILSTSIEEINNLLNIALKHKKKLEIKKDLNGEEKKEYDLLLKYIHSLNIILVYKQQSTDLSLETLSNETSKAIDIIIKSDYNN